jgi:uncharacterized OB-fold protein
MITVIDRSGTIPKLPRHSQLSRWHWQGLENGLLQTTRCTGCGRISFPPRPDCPDCLTHAWEWQQMAPEGTLYARTRIHVVPEAYIDSAPLNVGIVDLDMGVRLVCWLVEGADRLPPDAATELVALRFANGCLIGARPRQ